MQLKEQEYFGDKKRYCLIRKLGSGGFSEVWLAEDTKAGNIEIALKVYASAGGLDEEGVRMFSHEFSLMFNMNHSNLLKPTHFDEYENRPFLAIPFCKNGSAHKLIGQITEAEAWRFLHDVASGLAYLHNLNVIHQDISTENVLIDEQGNFLITDFGISAKARNTLRKSAINQQHSQESGGKVDFMAPELFSVNNEPVKSGDIWALGVTMYELLEGRLPFPQGLGGLAQKGGADIPNITDDFSDDLKSIVVQCLAKEPKDRPTAQQIVEWTEQHKRGESKQNPPPTPTPDRKTVFKKEIIKQPEQNTQTSKKASKKIIWIIAAVVAVIAAGIVFFVMNSKPTVPEPVVEEEISNNVEEEISNKKELVAEDESPQEEPITSQENPDSANKPPTETTYQDVKDNNSIKEVHFTVYDIDLSATQIAKAFNEKYKTVEGINIKSAQEFVNNNRDKFVYDAKKNGSYLKNVPTKFSVYRNEAEEVIKPAEPVVVVTEALIMEDVSISNDQIWILPEPIFFDHDNSNLTSSAIQVLDRKVSILKKYPDVKIVIVGNTCDLGGDHINIPMGQRYADAASDYLIKNGIDARRITTVSQAASEPMLPNTNEQNRAKNRRCDFRVSGY